MKTTFNLALLTAFAGSLACASSLPPPELVSARTAYSRASDSPTASINPTDLHTAKKALDKAERSFEQDGDSQITRDLGYAALRQTEAAESRARTMRIIGEKEQVVAQMHSSTAAEGKRTAAELASANRGLASKDQALLAQNNLLNTEVERREEAEKRAAQAAADLAKFATIKQETRGMVITLAGGVLFASGKADLLPAAQLKLNDVAKALTEQDPESKMVVEGHTDSQGSAPFNQTLSQNRAQSVRDYLVSRGIASDRIRAEGFGLSRSIADNATPEGRANNRRVEIIVQPKS